MMDTIEQIKARMTPDVLAFAEKTYRLFGYRRNFTEIDEVLFYQTVSLAYTYGRCDANDEVYAGLRKAHGVK